MKRIVLALMMVGCGGEFLEERESAVIFSVADDAFAGYSVHAPGSVLETATATWTESTTTGVVGDGFAQHVNIGGTVMGSCAARAGTITVLPGITHSTLFVYGDTGTILGAAVSGQVYKMTLKTTTGGATMTLKIENLTTGVTTNYTKNRPSTCTFFGESASFLIERPIWGTRRPLAHFSDGDFASAFALDKFGNQVFIGTGNTLEATMVNGAAIRARVNPTVFNFNRFGTEWVAQ